MSWTATLQEHCTQDKADEGFIPEDFNVSPPYDSMHDEPKEQFNIAVEAAEKLITSGVVGSHEGCLFDVRMSGHANPDHEPASGYANDFVSVQVVQYTPPKREGSPVNITNSVVENTTTSGATGAVTQQGQSTKKLEYSEVT